jgi:hypothetical protein
MKLEPVQITIGSKRYDVGMETREWTSPDGTFTRQYITIGKPGIREVATAYITNGEPRLRSCDISVETDHGNVVWTAIAGGISWKKIAGINAWFVAILKK